MQFYNWFSCYDEYRAWLKTQDASSVDPALTGPKGKHLGLDAFIRMRKSQLQEYKTQGFPPAHIAVQEDRLEAERKWSEDGHPYYNVHPELVKKFCSVNLSKVPAEFVEMPHGYDSVAVRFAQQHDELTISDSSAMGIPSGSFIKSILMTRGFNTLRHYEAKHEFEESLYCLLNFSTKANEGHAPNALMVLPVWFRSGETLEEALDNFILGIEQEKGLHVAEVDKNCLKILVTIGFLANSNDELIEYDVLSRYKNEFRDTSNEERKKTIITKSKRRGKTGFNVGNDIIFLGERPLQERNGSDPTGRELNYAHIRGGHPHAVRHGEGKRKVKIMWFRTTTVRSDLPFKKEL